VRNNRNRQDIVLNMKMANKIRKLRTRGLKLKDIANIVNVKYHNVANVLYDNIWR